MERLEKSSSLPSGVTEVSTTVAETIAEGVATVGAEANGDVASAASDDAGGKAGEEEDARTTRPVRWPMHPPTGVPESVRKSKCSIDNVHILYHITCAEHRFSEGC